MVNYNFVFWREILWATYTVLISNLRPERLRMNMDTSHGRIILGAVEFPLFLPCQFTQNK